MRGVRIAAIAVLSLLAGCGVATEDDNDVYTLYRRSPVGEDRVHVATFDADQSGDYNLDNCLITRDHFKERAVVEFWCEKGRFRP
jgi:hypothetical protein